LRRLGGEPIVLHVAADAVDEVASQIGEGAGCTVPDLPADLLRREVPRVRRVADPITLMGY